MDLLAEKYELHLRECEACANSSTRDVMCKEGRQIWDEYVRFMRDPMHGDEVVFRKKEEEEDEGKGASR